MLKNFLYIDPTALSEYLSQVEGGATTTTQSRSTHSTSGKGGIDVKVASAGGERQSADEQTVVRVDTDSAKLDRLLKAGHDAPDELGWVEVSQPDIEFSNIGFGAMVEWECEIEVAPFTETISPSGEFTSMMGMVPDMAPLAEAWDLDMSGLSRGQLAQTSQVGKLIGKMKLPRILVGGTDDTTWQIAGVLDEGNIHEEINGYAVVIGKVDKVIEPGKWWPLVKVPGARLLSRAERRAQENIKPKPGQENQFLKGPTIILNLLAIYR